MATTRFAFTPESAHFPTSNYAPLTTVNARPVLAYDGGSTNEEAYWTFVAPQGLSGALSVVIHYFMASATTGNVRWGAQLEAVTPGDATDLDASTSFDTANEEHGAVPGTAGYLGTEEITLTNADSIAAGDYVRINIYRDASDTTNDTATGDAYLVLVELREA